MFRNLMFKLIKGMFFVVFTILWKCRKFEENRISNFYLHILSLLKMPHLQLLLHKILTHTHTHTHTHTSSIKLAFSIQNIFKHVNKQKTDLTTHLHFDPRQVVRSEKFASCPITWKWMGLFETRWMPVAWSI